MGCAQSRIDNEESVSRCTLSSLSCRKPPKSPTSDLIRSILKVRHISPGRVSCSFIFKSRISNFYNGLHRGAVAAIAERICMACARTLVPEEKQLFLGELSVSYLSAASINGEIAGET